MLKVAFINSFGKVILMDMTVIPRVGDKVNLYYTPYPEVNAVLWQLDKEKRQAGLENIDI